MKNKLVKTFTVVERKILIGKPMRIYTHSGSKTLKPGKILWKETCSRPNSGWPLCEKGFVIEHYHGYGQNELFPWDKIKVVQSEEIREIVIKKSNKTTFTKTDFYG